MHIQYEAAQLLMTLVNMKNYLLSLFLEFLDDTLVDASALVDEMAGGGGLAGVHMADHHDVDVSLFLTHDDSLMSAAA